MNRIFQRAVGVVVEVEDFYTRNLTPQKLRLFSRIHGKENNSELRTKKTNGLLHSVVLNVCFCPSNLPKWPNKFRRWFREAHRSPVQLSRRGSLAHLAKNCQVGITFVGGRKSYKGGPLTSYNWGFSLLIGRNITWYNYITPVIHL